MIETILIALVTARIRGNKLIPFFKSWTVYPFLFLELIHLLFQIQVFVGNYSYIQYAPWLKRVYLFCFIIPIVVHKEYKEGMIGSLFVFAGTLLNLLVIRANGGRMPVFPNFSYITGYVDPKMVERMQGLHMLGDETTQLWFLADMIDIGYSVLSVGDLLIRVFAFLIVFKTVKVVQSETIDVSS